MHSIGLLWIVITILACAVTYLAWKNGKTTRENTERILKAMSESSNKILEGIRVIALLILSETSEEKKEHAKKLLETKTI